LLLNISRALSCSVRELAGLADLDRSTLARSLKPLFKQGFIIDAKSPGTRDSRLELTKCGQETVLAAGELWTQAQKALERHFGQSGLKELESVMARLEAL
jgi:DNA-binding MarR family transcriptional regulator